MWELLGCRRCGWELSRCDLRFGVGQLCLEVGFKESVALNTESETLNLESLSPSCGSIPSSFHRP